MAGKTSTAEQIIGMFRKSDPWGLGRWVPGPDWCARQYGGPRARAARMQFIVALSQEAIRSLHSPPPGLCNIFNFDHFTDLGTLCADEFLPARI